MTDHAAQTSPSPHSSACTGVPRQRDPKTFCGADDEDVEDRLASNERMESRPQLSTLNEHVICKLCKGYLIDATTVTECVHTFCKSCLVKHLKDKNTCPTCDIVIHPSCPLKYIRRDNTMQDIVYKLVPDLQYEEMKRQREFYQHKGLPCPMALHPGLLNETDAGSTASCSKNNEAKSSEELVKIFLKSGSIFFKRLQCKFIRCSSKASITTLKKFVAMKLFNNIDRYNEIDIICKEEILGDDDTVDSVYVTRWKVKEPPLTLYYSPKVEL